MHQSLMIMSQLSILITVDSEFSCDLFFANFSFRNNSRFLEFVSEVMYNFNSYLKLGVFNISKNFEFGR